MSSLASPDWSSRAPEASSSSIAASPRLELRGLVLGPLDGEADVAHLLGDAGEGLGDPGLRLGRRVGGLDRFLLRTEGVDLGLETLGRKGELLLLALEGLVLRLQVGDLLLERGTAGQGLAGQVLTAEREGLAALVLQLGGLALELVELQLQTLAGGRHVGDAPAYLLEQLQLLLVRVIEGLARVLGPVKGLVRLRAEDHPHTLHDTAHGLRAPPSDGLQLQLLQQNPQYGPCIHYRTVRATMRSSPRTTTLRADQAQGVGDPWETVGKPGIAHGRSRPYRRKALPDRSPPAWGPCRAPRTLGDCVP